jgi:hypothetical protein
MADGTWDFYFTHDGQAPLLVALDLAFGDRAPLAELPERLIVSVTMRRPSPNGLRAPDEGAALFALEDQLAAVLVPAGWVRVGRVVTRGRTDFIYQGPVGELPELSSEEYPLRSVRHTDASWDLYRNFLWPGAREWQQMQNRRGLLQLKQGGDQVDTARPIEHVARALDEEAALAGAGALADAGFQVGALTATDDLWTIPFSRADAPARIDAVTMEILEALEGMEDVVYGGWSCGVVGA